MKMSIDNDIMVRESVQYAAGTQLNTGTNVARREIRFKDPANISAEEVAAMAEVLNIAALFQTIIDLPDIQLNERNKGNE
jgi:hypothetical protein